MTDEKWEEKRPTIEGLREWDKTFLSMYVINLWDLTIKLEKALDKACSKITWLCDDYESYESIMDVDDWKEWCMNDD